MNTNLKVALSAVAIAVLASPVMAKSHSHHAPLASISNAYGAAVGAAPVVPENKIYVNDAVHVPFPQQGD
jgi:hydroxyethylthiazole kinase-like sugar kinase family protein